MDRVFDSFEEELSKFSFDQITAEQDEFDDEFDQLTKSLSQSFFPKSPNAFEPISFDPRAESKKKFQSEPTLPSYQSHPSYFSSSAPLVKQNPPQLQKPPVADQLHSQRPRPTNIHLQTSVVSTHKTSIEISPPEDEDDELLLWRSRQKNVQPQSKVFLGISSSSPSASSWSSSKTRNGQSSRSAENILSGASRVTAINLFDNLSELHRCFGPDNFEILLEWKKNYDSENANIIGSGKNQKLISVASGDNGHLWLLERKKVDQNHNQPLTSPIQKPFTLEYLDMYKKHYESSFLHSTEKVFYYYGILDDSADASFYGKYFFLCVTQKSPENLTEKNQQKISESITRTIGTTVISTSQSPRSKGKMKIFSSKRTDKIVSETTFVEKKKFLILFQSVRLRKIFAATLSYPINIKELVSKLTDYLSLSKLLIPGKLDSDIANFFKTSKISWFPSKPSEQINYPEIHKKFLDFEKSFLYPRHNVGVLYIANPNQFADENGIFSNREISPKFQRFLNFLGDKVPLKGFTGWHGGLDVRNGTTGEESIYTVWKEQMIMYHISVMLPYFPADAQQLERKRHIGNDILVLVYLENEDCKFDPSLMRTQFNHVFVVVTQRDNGTIKVEVATREGVLPFSPKIPNIEEFKLDDRFREFMLTKLINGERSALQASVFAVKTDKVQNHMMSTIIDDLKEVVEPDDKKKSKEDFSKS